MQADFFKDVFEVVRLIPAGRVSTYGAIAKYLGTAKSARIVGYAMNASHGEIPFVPAHRVVNRLGMLSGKSHFAYPSQMQELLALEGVMVNEDFVINFNEHFWDPNLELNI